MQGIQTSVSRFKSKVAWSSISKPNMAGSQEQKTWMIWSRARKPMEPQIDAFVQKVPEPAPNFSCNLLAVPARTPVLQHNTSCRYYSSYLPFEMAIFSRVQGHPCIRICCRLLLIAFIDFLNFIFYIVFQCILYTLLILLCIM